MAQADLSPVCSARQIAEIFGLSEIEIGRLSRAGVLPRIPRDAQGRAYDYPLVECTKAYLKYRNSKAVRDRELLVARKLKTELERGRKLRLENERTSTRYADVTLITQRVRGQHFRVRQRLLELPARLARSFPGDPIQNEAILMQEVLDVLTALSSPIILDEDQCTIETEQCAFPESNGTPDPGNGDEHLPGGDAG